jgi:hypothetical protein
MLKSAIIRGIRVLFLRERLEGLKRLQGLKRKREIAKTRGREVAKNSKQ